MIRIRAYTVLAAVVGFGPGCVAGDQESPQFIVRDSVGVRIVESTAALWGAGEAWTISPEPMVTIGAASGESEYLLSRIAGAVRFTDGSIAVGDGDSNEIRFFDSRGEFVTRVGRSGQGPGEFEYLRWVQQCTEDLVHAFDLNWDVTVFSRSGDVVREFIPQGPEPGRPAYDLSCSREGGFVATGWGSQTIARPIGFFVATAPIAILDESGTVVSQIGEFVASERIGTEFGSRPHPFSRSTVVGMAADRVFVGTAERMEMLVFEPQGGLRSVWRGPTVDLEIRPTDLDRYREERVAAVDPSRRPAVEREVRDMPLSPAFPAYDRLQVDEELNVWVRRFRRPGVSEVNWAVFREDGVFLGDVEGLGSIEVLQIGVDYILGVHRDELGVETLRVHSVRRS